MLVSFAKEPYKKSRPTIGGSFAENDLQLKASYGSSPSCTHRYMNLCLILQEASLMHRYINEQECE